MKQELEYVNVKDNIPNDITYGTVLNINTNNVNAFTHGFHKYPAKFIPQIPRWAINKYLCSKKHNIVLDPFCGSGTTLLESMLIGHNAIGIDIDPLSVLISKVKTTPLDTVKLKIIKTWLLHELKHNQSASFYPKCENIGHWFSNDTIDKLSKIRSSIEKIPSIFGNSQDVCDIYDLLIICFSSIIRKASNADNESQKTYVSHTNIKKPEEAYALFVEQLEIYSKRIIQFSQFTKRSLKSEVICGSSTERLKDTIGDRNINLVITSPPYIKAIDYIYNQMVELFWIGDIFGLDTQEKQNMQKTQYVGTKQIKKALYNNYVPHIDLANINDLDSKLQQIYDTDDKNGHKHSYITYKYFMEMEKHFFELNSLLCPGTHYVLVVGDSTVSNININTSDILTQIAKKHSFEIANRWGYKIKNRYMRFDRKGRGGLIKVDWVLDFVKT